MDEVTPLLVLNFVAHRISEMKIYYGLLCYHELTTGCLKHPAELLQQKKALVQRILELQTFLDEHNDNMLTDQPNY